MTQGRYPMKPDPALDAQISKAVRAVAHMPAADYSSMIAAQGLHAALGRNIARMKYREDESGIARKRVALAFEMLTEPDINRFPYDPVLTDNIRLLLPADRKKLAQDLQQVLRA